MGNTGYTSKFEENTDENIVKQYFNEIKSKCLQQGRLFEDETFPANYSSLFFQRPPNDENLTVKWLRPKVIRAKNEFLTKTTIPICHKQDLDYRDCWVVAAAATLADHETLLKQVVPNGQSFDQGAYAGIFLFRFFYFGRWVEICIDDRLPTYERKLLMVHSSQTNEFWGALLEKAYAKLFGCYESLQGGLSGDALSNFTGGIVETYRLKNDAQVNLAEMLVEAVARGSLACAGIWGDNEKNPVLESGLVAGHAYTVVDAEKVKFRNDYVTLVKVRNPWGNNIEWNGPWSDHSPMWSEVPPDVKSRLSLKINNDGDFWMDVKDFIKHFDDADICNLTPDSVETHKLRPWNTITYYGSWKRGQTAGGRVKYKTFAINPQFALDLQDAGTADVVIELSQKPQRKRPDDHLDIGFLLYKLTGDDQIPVSSKFFDQNSRVAGVDYYSNLRTITKRFSLKVGKYLIIPSAWEPGQEGEFMLRIWSESNLKSSDPTNDTNILPAIPQIAGEISTQSQAIQFFKAFAGEDLQINVFDLQNGLNQLYAHNESYRFDIDCCRSMILLFDIGGHYKLNLDQFLNLFYIIDNWTKKFLSIDGSNGGFINFIDYSICIMELNFVQIDKRLINYLSFRYADSVGRISYSNYVQSLIKLSLVKSMEFEYDVIGVGGCSIDQSQIRSISMKY